MWNDYGFIRPGRSPDYVWITLSNSVITTDAEIGDILGTLSTGGGRDSYRFTLASNPYFVLVGNVVHVSAELFDGLYPLRVTAKGPAGTYTQAFNVSAVPPGGQTPYVPPIFPPPIEPPPIEPPPSFTTGIPFGLLLALLSTSTTSTPPPVTTPPPPPPLGQPSGLLLGITRGSAAFSTRDSTPTTVLSNVNLTLTTNHAILFGGSRARPDFTPGGKYYFEFRIDAAEGDDYLSMGISELANAGNPGTNYMVYWNNDEIDCTTDVTVPSVPSSVGSIVRVAIDLVNFTAFVAIDNGHWNNNVTVDPVANVGGIDISGWSGYYAYARSYGIASTTTVNFGRTGFVYLQPSGFIALA